jgi:type II secretory pathway pseudopilin PulG
MNMYWKNRQAGWKRQKGMTLMELLVAGFISIIVSSGMVILMASTLGTGTQTIKMTQLSGELRAAMQIMTRELRRSSYHSTFTTCFGDLDCLSTLGIDTEVSEININAGGDCFWFWYDRPQRCPTSTCTIDQLAAAQTAIDAETVAAFRRMVNDDGTGIIQMAVTTDTSISCGDDLTDSDWADITNSNLIDVEAFNVDDAVTGFESYLLTINGSQSIERIGITMTGRLLASDASLPTWMQDGSVLPLTIRDFIRVRNDIPSL